MDRKLIFLIIFLLFPRFCFSQGLEAVPSFIHKPQDLSLWLLKEFRYEGEMPNYWQRPEETLNLRKGDCEDFAILSQVVLARLGINSQIVIIKFKNLKQSHAICIFKDNQSYSFIDNRKLIQTPASSIKEAIQERYPDWERIIFTNSRKQYVKVVMRGKVRDAK